MESYKNSFGQYDDDKSIILELEGNADDYHWCRFCINDENDILTLVNNDKTTIVKMEKENFKVIGYPKFMPGDHVRRIDGSRTGIVYNVLWIEHSDTTEDYFVYLLDYPDRRSTRWNKAEELEKDND